MRQENSARLLAVILALSVACFALGWWAKGPLYISGGTAGLGYLLLRAESWRRRPRAKATMTRQEPHPQPAPFPARPEPADSQDPRALVDEMLAQGRYALLLRPQIAANLSDAQVRRARTLLNAEMGLVPDGSILLAPVGQTLDLLRQDFEEGETGPGRKVHVGAVFLDRYPVTNRQFYEFVAAGGYKQVSLWETAIWTAVLSMTDRTGKPGPRYWMDGIYLEGQEDHPVVGVSWYEAAAFARWSGKRLPSDAEWVKAGAWPLPDEGAGGQRRYPWGDTMDRGKANLWGSGPEAIVSTRKFGDGVSVGGIYQMIGNVWEWTSGNFRGFESSGGRLAPTMLMKSIRGGAFDTYFDHQATCQFQSGESPLRRKHNIGFRCAVGGCDLVVSRDFGRSDKPGASASEPRSELAALPAATQPAENPEEVPV